MRRNLWLYIKRLLQKQLLERVKKTTEKAIQLNLVSQEIQEIKIQDKNGICHELVNDGKIAWGESNGDL